MADPVAAGEPSEPAGETAGGGGMTRKEKRKAMKKLKRKQLRKEAAVQEREEEEARSNDPEEQLRIRLREQEEAEIAERERKVFEERERLWLEAAAARKAAEEEEMAAQREELLEESREKEDQQKEHADELEEGDEWDYVEEGPAEIIWQGNEIIVKKKRVRVAKKSADRQPIKEDDDRPTSNPLPPQSVAFASYKTSMSAQEVLEKAAQQIPNFGTEQDKAHCPFHLKTGACRFGSRCSRVHFYPDKSCTLLIKNMYSGPGLAWEQDEGLEYTDEEVERCYEEFYEDVHTEFLKFGELVNFKVCRNGSHHLRGNVYVHYKSLDSALLAYSNTNGRYYAGKQMTCEFVAITRWKVAICGEYMKSGLKTCSHGTACNFIHCFRNPGGDYEWADWDNPPPKYWIRKMSALFGHPESAYDKQMELEDHEKSRESNRKKTPTNNRYHSRSIDGESDVRDSFSIREDPDIKRDQYSRHSVRRVHSHGRRKETAFLDKHEQSEENKSEIRYCLPSHDSGEDISKTRDGDFLEKHWKYKEKNNVDDYYKRKHRTAEELSRKERGRAYSSGQSKPEKRHKYKSHEVHKKEHGSSDWHLGNDNNKRVPSIRPSGDKTGGILEIDEERYNGGYYSECSDGVGTSRDSSMYKTKKEYRQSEKRECDRYSSHHKSHKSLNYESDDENSKLRKQRTGSQRNSINDSANDWKSTDNSDQEDADDNLPSNKTRSYRQYSRSGRKRKHHPGKDAYRKFDGEISNSDSDSTELNRSACKKHSRSRTSNH